ALPAAPVSPATEAAQGQEHGLGVMAQSVRQAIAIAGVTIDRVAAIGVATPGSMDIPAGLILDPPNLKPWRNVPVRQFIADTFRLPTAFQNDANAAAYGEYWVGAGREYRSMVLFTLGTGVGGGIILDDKVIEGEHRHGGGHRRPVGGEDRGRNGLLSGPRRGEPDARHRPGRDRLRRRHDFGGRAVPQPDQGTRQNRRLPGARRQVRNSIRSAGHGRRLHRRGGM